MDVWEILHCRPSEVPQKDTSFYLLLCGSEHYYEYRQTIKENLAARVRGIEHEAESDEDNPRHEAGH